ncbi:MAG: hypothetical protein IH851_02895 [Armatimonadetes bacterium]|nr:hypothetical protein [Armatimonadota bacterium]
MTRRIALWGLYVGVLLAVAGMPVDIYFDLSDSHGVAGELFFAVGILLVGWAVKSLWGPEGLARLLRISSAGFLALAVCAAVFGIIEIRFQRFGPQDIPVVGQLVLFLGVPVCLSLSLLLFVVARALKKESMQNGHGPPSQQRDRDLKGDEKSGMPRWLHRIGVAVIVLGIAFLVFEMAVIYSATGPEGWKDLAFSVIGTSVGFMASLAIVSAVHELGHLVAGWAVGYRFVALQVLGLSIERTRKWFRLEFRRPLEGPRSFVSMHPRRWRPSVIPGVVFIAGGPLAHLAFGCALLALGFWPGLSGGYEVWVHPAESADDAVLFPLIRMTGLVALLSIPWNLVPRTVGGHWTDGMLLKRLLQPDGKGVAYSAMQAVGASIAEGKRPRDWDRAAVMYLDQTDYPDGWVCAYYYHYDRDEIDQAGKVLDRLLGRTEDFVEVSRHDIFAEAAFYEAIQRKNRDTAQEFLEKAEESPDVLPILLDRARASIQLVSGDHAAAARIAQSALEAIEREVGWRKHRFIFSKRVLQVILAEAKSAQEGSS